MLCLECESRADLRFFVGVYPLLDEIRTDALSPALEHDFIEGVAVEGVSSRLPGRLSYDDLARRGD